jgi:sugar diacid utilization regulator
VSAIRQDASPASIELSAAATRIVARLREQIEQLTDDTVREIFSDIAAYQTMVPAPFVADVREHVLEHNAAILDSLERRTPVTLEDLLFVRKHAAKRVGLISVADFIHAFQVGQHVVLDASIKLAVDDRSRQAVLSLVTLIARYYDVVIAHAAEVYLEAEQLLASAGERVRRDLLEDLLAGKSPAPGPRQDAARAAGLDERSACLVIAALPTASTEDPHALRAAATALGRAARHRMAPLIVVHHDEIVVVTPTTPEHAAALGSRCATTQQRLAQRSQLPLAVGISTVYEGLATIGDAYREAVAARDRLLPNPGVAALPTMTMFDYLTMHGDPTARRIVPPAIERFVAEDRKCGGVLIATLQAYAAADLNVKRASEELHVHVNTAHYRLGRIAERTGRDLRRINDVIELLIATRLASEPTRSGAG